MNSTIRKLICSAPRLTVFGAVMLFSFSFMSHGVEGYTMGPDTDPEEVSEDQTSISGTITDESGVGLPGANVVEIGTSNGTITDVEGNYSLTVGSNDARLLISFVGYEAIEVPVSGRSNISVSLSEDISSLEEVVVVGYGTQKKVNLTGAVSTTGSEVIESRPIANAQQALQGVVPNLVIAPNTAGGEPGADFDMTIRGLQSFEGSNSPLVLVDNIPMSINDVNPADIESVSVLKDAASAAIYGARAAYGVIMITTKKGSGKARVNYTANFAQSGPTIWPEFADPLDAIYAHNDAAINAGRSPYYDADAIDRFMQNQANPGSAPSMLANTASDNWIVMNTGMMAVGNTDWEEVLVNRTAPINQHNLSISGGTEDVNYYVSTGYMTQQGLLKVGNEEFNRFNIDAKVSARATEWLTVEFLTKYRHNNEDFPWNPTFGRAWIMNWISKLKPGLPVFYDGTDIYTTNSRIGEWKVTRERWKRSQLTLSPRLIFEPVKDWVTNVQFNYVSNNNIGNFVAPQYEWIRPSGTIDFQPGNREGTRYMSVMQNNEYFSPNIFSSYTKSFGNHNFGVMVGYQHEVYRFNDMAVNASHLITDQVPSLKTTVGQQELFPDGRDDYSDEMGHWGTMGYFGRINYNFDEKYLIEANIRRDGSSRFDPNERWGTFTSVSAGWNIANESFFPLKDQVDQLKLRASYGQLGNQDVENYLYVPTMNNPQTSRWLFSGARPWTVTPPNITSINLTWEQVATIDVGLDFALLGSKLTGTFDWYESRTTNLVGPGEELPAVLGTDLPKRNEGEIVTRGWEMEITWRDRINDFSYQVRGVLSDYQSEVVSYNNPTGLLPTNTRFYQGQMLGEIWGYRTDGLYQSQEEIDAHNVVTSALSGFAFNPGDVRYQDLNGDGAVSPGDNTVDSPGDQVILGNNTPRFQYGFSGNASWKGLDISFFWQGVAKRDLWPISGTQGVFRGPGGGPMHAGALVEHIDYWRDDTSPLGANPDAYFPKPYSQYVGQNGKNYSQPNDRFMQNGAYLRLKNLQVGYTFPTTLTEKVFISNARIYVSGENLLTFTDLLFFDPEAFAGRWYGAGDAYPLNKSYSMGLSVTF